VTVFIHSSAGSAFKNDDINTVLTVTIYKGGQSIKNQSQLIAAFGNNAYLEWSVRKHGDSSFTTILATDSHLSNGGFAYTVSAADVDTQAVFGVELITD